MQEQIIEDVLKFNYIFLHDFLRSKLVFGGQNESPCFTLKDVYSHAKELLRWWVDREKISTIFHRMDRVQLMFMITDLSDNGKIYGAMLHFKVIDSIVGEYKLYQANENRKFNIEVSF